MARIDLWSDAGHLIIRGPFNTAAAVAGGNIRDVPPELWTVNKPATRPRHLPPATPDENPEWIREHGRYLSAQQAIVAAARELGIRLSPPRRRRLPPPPRRLVSVE